MVLLKAIKAPQMVKVPHLLAKEVSVVPLDKSKRKKDIPDSIRNHSKRIHTTP
jgi:hypothetical protein